MITALNVLAALLVFVALAVAAFAVRRRVIRRRGITFDCSLRFPGADDSASGSASASAERGRGWTFGLAQYSQDAIEWYRVFSYSPRPAEVFTRRQITVTGRRDPAGQEELALFPGWSVIECTHSSRAFELAMSPDALTGLLAWLEAAPPGQHVNVA